MVRRKEGHTSHNGDKATSETSNRVAHVDMAGHSEDRFKGLANAGRMGPEEEVVDNILLGPASNTERRLRKFE